MTVTAAVPAAAPIDQGADPRTAVRVWGTPRLLAGTGHGRLDLAHHRAVHPAPARWDRAALTAAADAVGLLGRGGAAFPVAAKLRSLPERSGRSGRTGRPHVLVNGSEGEPASHKDRVLMTLAPHLVLDGALVVARALAADRIVIAVHDHDAHASLAAALTERGADPTAAPNAQGIELVHQAHGFVGGEIRALTRAVDGGPATPTGRRTPPTVRGLGGRPTFASNVETFAQIALLAGLGVEAFGRTGSADEPGTTLLTLLGDVPQPGVVEVPTGLPLSMLLGETGVPGEGAGPVLIGGYHGTWLPAGARDLTLSRPALRKAGVPLNAGVIARLPADTCALGEVATVTRWLAGESAGQCGPCLFGLPALADTLEAVAVGRPVLPDAWRRVQALPGRGACAHPDGAAAFVGSALAAMADEISVHQHHGHCGRPLRGTLPTVAAAGTRVVL